MLLLRSLAFLFFVALLPASLLAGSDADLQKFIQGGATATLNLPLENKLLSDFYTKRHYAPAWDLQEGNAADVAGEFKNFIRDTLAEHGLSERGYRFDALERHAKAGTKESLLKADILASDIVLRLAHSLSGQNPTPQSKLHTWPLKRGASDVATGLHEAVNDRRVPEYLASLAPQTNAYTKLKVALQRYREIAAKGGWIRVRPGLILTPESDDARVTQIYQRLAQEGYIDFDAKHYQTTLYDGALVDAMRSFQETHGLYPDGNVGPETYRALNIPVKDRIDQIRVNMARLRQSPPEAWEGIVINIPSAKLALYKGGSAMYEAPVVVGRVDRPSPLVSSNIYEMIINPSWYVPESIAQKDLFPKAEEDPNFFKKQGIKRHTLGSDEDPEHRVTMLRQDPGPLNSLGRIKFNFQNRHAVYLHGTPHVELFGRDDRTRSSGCIRLKEPMELAQILMSNASEWNAETIQKKIDSLKTQRINTPSKMPIKLLYWTNIVDSKDRVQFYNDVYGLDAEWLKYL